MTSPTGAEVEDADDPTAARVRQAQRRAVRVLAIGQFFNGLAIAIDVGMAPLAATRLSGSDVIGGLAPTCIVIGTAISALPLAWLASRRGRRPALATGLAVAAVGNIIAVTAAVADAWGPLLLGMLLSGVGSAAGYATRYAATDLAEPARRGSALALVVWPTTVGVVLGPNLLAPTQRLAGAVGMAPLAGPFAIAAAGYVISAVLVFLRLRPDPLLLARSMELVASKDDRPGRRRLFRSGRTVLASPRVRWCGYALTAGHAAMIALMAMAPVDMQMHALPLSTIGIVVSGHLFGMYAFSPVIGWLTDRFGAPRVLLTGLVTTAVAALLCFAGAQGHSWLVGVGLFVLGVGWSGDVVAGSALLTDVTPLADRPVAQGFSDLAMDVGGALASVTAGLVTAASSFAMLAIGVFGLVVLFLPFQIRTLLIR